MERAIAHLRFFNCETYMHVAKLNREKLDNKLVQKDSRLLAIQKDSRDTSCRFCLSIGIPTFGM